MRCRRVFHLLLLLQFCAGQTTQAADRTAQRRDSPTTLLASSKQAQKAQTAHLRDAVVKLLLELAARPCHALLKAAAPLCRAPGGEQAYGQEGADQQIRLGEPKSCSSISVHSTQQLQAQSWAVFTWQWLDCRRHCAAHTVVNKEQPGASGRNCCSAAEYINCSPVTSTSTTFSSCSRAAASLLCLAPAQASGGTAQAMQHAAGRRRRAQSTRGRKTKQHSRAALKAWRSFVGTDSQLKQLAVHLHPALRHRALGMYFSRPAWTMHRVLLLCTVSNTHSSNHATAQIMRVEMLQNSDRHSLEMYFSGSDRKALASAGVFSRMPSNSDLH